jgi:hypothetical protein
MPPKYPPDILPNDRVIGATASSLPIPHHIVCCCAWVYGKNLEIPEDTYFFPFQGFCLNRVGLVVRVEGMGLARRFYVHWDDHPAKVNALSLPALPVLTSIPGITSCAGAAQLAAL